MPVDIGIAYDKNTNLLTLSHLKNALTELAITDGDGITITALIYLKGESTGPINATPLSFTYSATTKKWKAVVPLNYGLVLQTTYDAVVIADGGNLNTANIRLRFEVAARYQGGR